MLSKQTFGRVNKFTKCQIRLPSLTYACTFINPSIHCKSFTLSHYGQNSIRHMATSSPGQYDIDFVTMKKTPVNKRTNKKNQFLKLNKNLESVCPSMESLFSEMQNAIPNLESGPLSCIPVLSEIEVVNDELASYHLRDMVLDIYGEEIDKELSDKFPEIFPHDFSGFIGFIYSFYPEFQDFQVFLQRKYNNSQIEISQFTGSEFKSEFSKFVKFYLKNKNCDKDKIRDLHNMQNILEMVLGEAPHFSQLWSEELIPRVEFLSKVMSFFSNDLYYFSKELESLDKEFDFNKCPSVKKMTSHIESMLGYFDEFLTSNAEVDEVFYKVLVQCTRYQILCQKLKSVSNMNLKDIRKIIKTPSFKASTNVIDEYFEATHINEDSEFSKRVDTIGCLLQFLISVDLVPANESYYEIAPILDKLSEENSIFGRAADKLLRCLNEQEIIHPIQLGKIIDNFNLHKTFQICNEKTTNFVLNCFLRSGYTWTEAKTALTTGANTSDLLGVRLALDFLVEYPQYAEKIFSDPNLEDEYNLYSNYPCIPSKFVPSKDIPILKRIRDELDTSFEMIGSLTELIGAIKKLGPQYDNMCDNLVAAYPYFCDEMWCLDEYIDGYHELEPKEKEAKKENHFVKKELYAQIPEWIKLENHISEIMFLKQELGDFSDKNYVLRSLDNLSQSMIDYEKYFPDVDIDSFCKLRSKLKEFGQNNSNDCFKILDTILLNQNAFSKFEQELARKSLTASSNQKGISNEPEKEKVIPPYVQIPDELKLHEFTKELIFLKNVLGRSFSEVSAEEIMNVLENEIENSFTASSTRSSLLASNTSDVFSFLRLKKKLHRLFDINGNNTEALDVLINSQQVFESFEESKKPVEYKQIPNDFNLEEYFLELIELKKALEVDSFGQLSAEKVLEKVQEFSEQDSEKSIIWGKLYRNLAMLFKHNSGSTFVLDNVIGSAQEFLKFETNQVEPEDKKPNSTVSEQGELLTGSEYEVLGDFLRFSNLLYRSDVHKVTPEEFNSMVDRFESTLDKSSSTYLFKKSVMDKLKRFNGQIEFYPPFLVCIYGTNCFGEFPMSSHQLEVFYDDLVRSLHEISAEENDIHENENHENDSVESKFDITDFAEKKTKYNDSERLIANLDKQNSSADFEAIKSAVHSAFEQPEKVVVVPRRVDTKFATKSKTKPVKNSTNASSQEVDKSKLEKYLQEAKKHEESKAREKEAYEWSKRAQIEVKQAKVNSKYCLLTLEGEVIPTSQQALGELPKEDVFKALNKFTKEELSFAGDVVKDLQSKNWKVIGSRVEGDKKYLVLVNNDAPSKAYRVVRSLLATTGLVLLTIIGINLWIDEDDQFNKAIAEYEKKVEVEKHGNNVAVSGAVSSGPFSVTQPKVAPPTIFGKENFTGVVESGDNENEVHREEEDNSLSWWQSLMWKK